MTDENKAERRRLRKERERKDPRMYVAEMQHKRNSSITRKSSISSSGGLFDFKPTSKRDLLQEEIKALKEKDQELEHMRIKHAKEMHAAAQHIKEEQNAPATFSPRLKGTVYHEIDDSIQTRAEVAPEENLEFITDNFDPLFTSIKRQCTCFKIWRVKESHLEEMPLEDGFDTLYNAEVYLFCVASIPGEASYPNKPLKLVQNTKLTRHAHIWLGNATEKSKCSVAINKSWELNKYCMHTVTIHREIQGFESPRLQSYFQNELRILLGAGRERSEMFHELPKLYKLTNKSVLTLQEMESVSWTHFTKTDILFLLTPKDILFQWMGRSTIPAEKRHATKVAIKIRDEANVKSLYFVDDGYELTMHSVEKDIFNHYLNLCQRQVEAYDYAAKLGAAILRKIELKFYKCSLISGKYCMTEDMCCPLHQEYLNNNYVFLIDLASKGIWIWCGRNIPEKDHINALRNARGFARKKEYPKWVLITSIEDGSEPTEFKRLFVSWGENEGVMPATLEPRSNFDIANHPVLAARFQRLDDGKGHLRIRRIRSKNVHTCLPINGRIFFDMECYVFHYTYQTEHGDKCIDYYWMGANSPPIDQNAIIVEMEERDIELHYGTTFVRVNQYWEPPHFLQIFHGKFIVFKGVSTDYDPTENNSIKPKRYMLEIVGSAPYNCYATEVTMSAAALNSNKCYLLKVKGVMFVWLGRHTNPEERDMAGDYAYGTHHVIVEGDETREFWKIIGGKLDFPTFLARSTPVISLRPQLFRCSAFLEHILHEEIIHYSQSNLLAGSVMLLDYITVLYIWIGRGVSKEDRSMICRLGNEYLKSSVGNRNLQTCIVYVRQDAEPILFSGFFPEWRPHLWENQHSYTSLRFDTEDNTEYLIQSEFGTVDPDDTHGFNAFEKYPIEFLTGFCGTLPENVNLMKKEVHLNNDDFLNTMKMTYKEFVNLPLKTQRSLKKKFGLL